MAFWLHEKELVVRLKGVRLLYKIITFTVAVVGIAGLTFFFFIQPLQRSLLFDQVTLIHEEQSLKEQKKDLANLMQINQIHDESEDKIIHYYHSTMSFQQTIALLLKAVQSKNIACRGIIPGNVVYKDFYDKYYFTIKTRGSFAQMLDFTQYINQHFPQITCQSCDIKKGSKNTLSCAFVMCMLQAKLPQLKNSQES